MRSSSLCIVMCSLRDDVLSTWSCTIPIFSFSNFAMICVSFSWRGSNWASLSYLLICMILSSSYRVFMSCAPLTRFVMLMEFFLCFNSWISVMITSSYFYSFWIISSSSNIVHGYVVLSNSCVTLLASFCITSTCRVSCCSLLVKTSGGFVGVSFYFISSFSFLYFSSVCAIIWICSSMFLMAIYALSGILVQTSFSFFSRLSAHCFSSFVSIFTYSTTSSRESFPFLVSCNFVTYVLVFN
jgi:hypothetical protein